MGLGVRYEIDHGLVRGLDYYTRTTFEFFVAGRRGQQQALGGGGRYDGLAELLGGARRRGSASGGIDRAVLAAAEQGSTRRRDGRWWRWSGADPERSHHGCGSPASCAGRACGCGPTAAPESSADSSSPPPSSGRARP